MTRMPLVLKLAVRELRSGILGFWIFLACLALGVAAIAGAGSLAASLLAGISVNASTLLGGDVEARVPYRPAAPELSRALNEIGRVSQSVEMRAMAITTDPRKARTLVEMKAVDTAYPLYGKIVTAAPGQLANLLARREGRGGAVAEPGLLARLGFAAGDSITDGAARFRINAVLTREPDRAAAIVTLGPRLMIASEALADTGLILPGSVLHYVYHVALAPSWTPATALAHLETAFPGAPWQLRTAAQVAPGLRTFLGNIGEFLTLVGLTALLVGGIGVANAVKAHIDGRLRTIAIFKSLGASDGLVFGIYATQIAILALAGILIGLAGGVAVPYVVVELAGDSLPVSTPVGIQLP
ncbi:MAG: FtsX-like permease family protein, partial [Alphaproteobacteria bacterium]|nr:FtsX-like permease family protein [Alphaproteobacteria bacterium]